VVDLVRVTGTGSVGVPLKLADGQTYVVPATVSISAAGAESAGAGNLALTPDGELQVVQPDEVGDATLNLTQKDAFVEIPVNNSQSVLGADITFSQPGSGAVVVAESTVGQLWFPMNMARVGAGGTLPMSAADDSSWRSSIVAKTAIRFRVSVAGAGTARITYSISTNPSLIQMSAALPPGNNRLGLISVDGPVAVTGQFWQAVQPISGTVTANVNGPLAVTQSGTWSVGVNGPVTIGGTVTVAGTVNVGNFPVTQQVGDAGGSLTVDTGAPGVFALTGALPTGANVIGATLNRAAVNAQFGQVANVGQTPVMILPARSTRQEGTIAPTTNGTFYVGSLPTMTATANSLSLTNTGYTHDAQTPLYVMAASGTMTFTFADEFN